MMPTTHFDHSHIRREEVERAVREWERLHGPIPRLPYKANEWKPSCGFHAYGMYEHPLELELGVDMRAL